MLTEFRTYNCKADAVVLNGTSNVCEIKSELDNLNRLNNQISAYTMVFDMVHLIASPSQIKKIDKSVDSSTGLMVLENDDIITLRNAASAKSSVYNVKFILIVNPNVGKLINGSASIYQELLLNTLGNYTNFQTGCIVN